MTDDSDQMKMAEQIYDDFWKEIVENDNGLLKKEAIIVELANFYWLMKQSATVYSFITGGKLNTPNHTAQEVLSECYRFFESKGREVLDNVEKEHERKLNLLRAENITLLETTWNA